MALGGVLNMDLSVDQREPYAERDLKELDIEPALLKKADLLHQKLIKRKMDLN
jgi:hypothetical protein